jgi:predicted DNA-binding transcriptional regulator AlpA
MRLHLISTEVLMKNLESTRELCPTCGQARVVNAAKQMLDALPDTAYVRAKLLLQIVPFSQATLWRKIASGDFPTPRKLSERVTGWRVREVREWLAKVS